jgi:hypothetical protein
VIVSQKEQERMVECEFDHPFEERRGADFDADPGSGRGFRTLFIDAQVGGVFDR